MMTTRKKATRRHDRAAGQTSMTISTSEELRERIDREYAKDRRTRSNWITKLIEDYLEKMDQEHAALTSGAMTLTTEAQRAKSERPKGSAGVRKDA